MEEKIMPSKKYFSYKIKRFFNKINIFRYLKNLFLCLKYPFIRWYGDPLYCGYPHRKHFSLDFTWYDEIPVGWRKAFGKQLLNEILKEGKKELKQLKDEGKKVTWEDILFWEQIKEKYGELRLYASATEDIQNILSKYELLSQCYCIDCGKPARYCSKGWIEYYCDKCFTKYLKERDIFRPEPITDDEIEKTKIDCRLTKKDIPQLTRYLYKDIKKDIETFDTEEECDNRWEELRESKDRPVDVFYRKRQEGDKFLVVPEKCTEKKINILKEYGIDFVKLWGLDDGKTNNKNRK